MHTTFVSFAVFAALAVAKPLQSLQPRAITIPGYDYAGCYTEATFGRALNGKTTYDDTMTNEKCAALCTGFTWFGTEYGRECFCGNSPAEGSKKVPEITCSYNCKGDSTQKCGGENRLTAWARTGTIVKDDTPVVYKSLGCYTELTSGRALKGGLYVDDTMTVAKCEAKCAGYTYYGLEYARECWCGNDLAAGSIKAPEADCSMKCKGNSTQKCGGNWRLNMFTIAAADVPAVVDDSVNYVREGCYTDTFNDRALTGRRYYDDELTVEKCSDVCVGYPFFGLEYGRECYCGYFIKPTSFPAPDADCKFACGGNSTQTCGAEDRLDIFKYVTTTTTTRTSTTVAASSTTTLLSVTTTPTPTLTTAASTTPSTTSTTPSSTTTESTTESSTESTTTTTESTTSSASTTTTTDSTTTTTTTESTTPIESSTTSESSSTTSATTSDTPTTTSESSTLSSTTTTDSTTSSETSTTSATTTESTTTSDSSSTSPASTTEASTTPTPSTTTTTTTTPLTTPTTTSSTTSETTTENTSTTTSTTASTARSQPSECATPPNGNLLRNPSFEEDEGTSTEISQWRVTASSAGGTYLTTNEIVSPNPEMVNSAYCGTNALVYQSYYYTQSRIEQRVTNGITSGAKYNVRVMLSRASLSTATCRTYIYLTDMNYQGLKFFNIPLTADDKWQQVEGTYTATGDGAIWQFVTWCTGREDVYFDGVVLEPVAA